MFDFEYLTDNKGNPKAVVVPIDVWRELLAKENTAAKEKIREEIEDYCLNKAMDEAKDSPVISRAEALKYLED